MTDDESENAELRDRAIATASDYMEKAIAAVDEVMGQGTARKHPALVAAFLLLAHQDNEMFGSRRRLEQGARAFLSEQAELRAERREREGSGGSRQRQQFKLVDGDEPEMN
jgi:hypothetical protein